MVLRNLSAKSIGNIESWLSGMNHPKQSIMNPDYMDTDLNEDIKIDAFREIDRLTGHGERAHDAMIEAAERTEDPDHAHAVYINELKA